MKVLVAMHYSLGDSIGAMPYIDKYSKESGNEVQVRLGNSLHIQLFQKSFPDLKFCLDCDISQFDEVKGLHYDYTQPLQAGYARQLGYENAEYIRPLVDKTEGERPIKNKYVTIGVQSTAQLKYWNHPNGKKSQTESTNWNELCGMIRNAGYTPVVIEKDELFGVGPEWNGIPKKAQKKIGLDLKDTINLIEHSEFFIGLSSGLSWLAHALGKPVAMISNFTEDWHEFDILTEDYKRIVNKSVCHGCWNRVGIEYEFDVNDWYWCPRHRGTSRQFECHTSITPEYVFNEIKNWL
jgi:autotransporter strand-loop-strand O-heptosyltransferase